MLKVTYLLNIDVEKNDVQKERWFFVFQTNCGSAIYVHLHLELLKFYLAILSF